MVAWQHYLTMDAKELFPALSKERTVHNSALFSNITNGSARCQNPLSLYLGEEKHHFLRTGMSVTIWLLLLEGILQGVG